LGKKGSGKTHFVIKKIIPCFKKTIILDAMDEYPFFPVYSVKALIGFLIANDSPQKKYKVNYRPHDENEEAFFELIYQIGNVTLVVEEIDLYCSSHSSDPFLKRIIRYGRHRNIDLIGVSRRPAEITKDLVSQSDLLLSFKQTQKIEIDFFRHYTSNPERLMKLTTGQFIVFEGESFFT